MVKIRLSEDEIYEIKMPEEIEIQNFAAIVTKFNFLLKNFSKFNMGYERDKGDILLSKDENHVVKKENRSRWNFLRNNKEAFIEISKAHYLGSQEDFKNAVKKYGINLSKADMVSIMGKALRDIHEIKPKDVGLKAFPTKNMQADSLRLGDIK